MLPPLQYKALPAKARAHTAKLAAERKEQTRKSGGGVVMLENGGVGQQLRQALDILGSMLARLQARPEGSRLEGAAAGPE